MQLEPHAICQQMEKCSEKSAVVLSTSVRSYLLCHLLMFILHTLLLCCFFFVVVVGGVCLFFKVIQTSIYLIHSSRKFSLFITEYEYLPQNIYTRLAFSFSDTGHFSSSTEENGSGCLLLHGLQASRGEERAPCR